MKDLTYDKETEITQLKQELELAYKKIAELNIIADRYKKMRRFMRFVVEEFWDAY